MPNSYEHSYQHDLDNVIDASDAILAIGTEKVDTTTLKDRSLTGNDGTIYDAMPSSGYFLGRRFNGDYDYIDCGNGVLYPNVVSFIALAQPRIILKDDVIIRKDKDALRLKLNGTLECTINGEDWGGHLSTGALNINKSQFVVCTYNESLNELRYYIDGVLDSIHEYNATILSNSHAIFVGANSYVGQVGANSFNGIIYYSSVKNNILSSTSIKDFFNTLARLPLYSHNFTQYPNSDTSLTAVFQYTSGIITSGSFNKTDGLKCTSAGTIIFSNNFEFDGSEYITLTIDGVEYSGTTTVTQGTITATIAQGSNDITIEMGTNDVLEDIQIQFRAEV